MSTAKSSFFCCKVLHTDAVKLELFTIEIFKTLDFEFHSDFFQNQDSYHFFIFLKIVEFCVSVRCRPAVFFLQFAALFSLLDTIQNQTFRMYFSVNIPRVQSQPQAFCSMKMAQYSECCLLCSQVNNCFDQSQKSKRNLQICHHFLFFMVYCRFAVKTFYCIS